MSIVRSFRDAENDDMDGELAATAKIKKQAKPKTGKALWVQARSLFARNPSSFRV